MKRITLLLMALGLGATVGFAQGNRIVCDETCRMEYRKTEASLPGQAEAAKARPAAVPGYAVVSPVGRTSVEMISQAPRLESLDGKTIAVVGVSFMTGVTHPEIKRLINEHYPSAKVLLLDEIGFSGPYPAPGVTRKQNEDFKRNFRDMKVDAVISGNGGCGLCTPKETGSCITAEYLGIPSVIIAGPGFADQARYTARNNGVPVMRVAVNAVMSGCKPEYMPVLIALTKGLGDGNFRRTLASTHAWAPRFCGAIIWHRPRPTRRK